MKNLALKHIWLNQFWEIYPR